MNAATLAFIAIRILALYEVVEGIYSITAQLGLQILMHDASPAFGGAPDTPMEVSVLPLVLGALPVPLGVLLWALAPRLARAVATGLPEGTATTALQPSALLSILVAFLGIFLVIDSLPALGVISADAITRATSYDPELTGMELRAFLASDKNLILRASHELVRLMLGLLFLLQPAGIRRLVQSLATRAGG